MSNIECARERFHKNAEMAATSDTTDSVQLYCRTCNKEATSQCSACHVMPYCATGDCQRNDWPRHKVECQNMCIHPMHNQKMYVRKLADGRGRGTFARTRIVAGARVLSEEYMFSVANITEAEIKIVWDQMEDPDRMAILTLAHDETKKTPLERFVSVIKRNAHKGQSGSQWLFFGTSLFNHDCTHNVIAHMDDIKNVMHLTAIYDIEPHEELTISYLPAVIMPRDMRQFTLRNNFGFTCLCDTCGRSNFADEGKRVILSTYLQTIKSLEPLRPGPTLYDELRYEYDNARTIATELLELPGRHHAEFNHHMLPAAMAIFAKYYRRFNASSKDDVRARNFLHEIGLSIIDQYVLIGCDPDQLGQLPLFVKQLETADH